MAKHDKFLDKLQEHLDEGETVQHSVFGAYETKIMGNDSVRNGIFAATNKRLVFYSKKLTGYDLEVFPYSNISSIEMGKNMMGHHISFFSSGNKAHMKWIKNNGVAEFVSYVKAQMGKKDAGGGASDPMDQLKKLAELKQQGILTEEEFAAKKKQLLGL